jgi:acetyltransferase-like isoleucine patch superfamily enzyme
MGGVLFSISNRLSHLYYRLKSAIVYRAFFGHFGKESVVRRPLLISNPQFIHIGDRVFIRDGVRLEVLRGSSDRIPVLKIGSGTNIEQNVHIVCQSRVEIGKEVSITGHCCIVDVTHECDDPSDSRHVASRIKDENSFVVIDDGSFLGFGAVVLPNVRIGKKCVIGALSVVVGDIPDYCVAAGSPARVIKRYDAETQTWVVLGSPNR